MKTKPDLKKHVQFDRPGRGCGMGCWSIGCMGVCGIFIMLCGAGYYSLFHSSLPLLMIKSAIEESGEVEIEGLKGSLSSGFSADELRFKTMDDHWSNLTDIKFKYDGDVSVFGTDSLIITELSVAGGTIYADWDPEQNELDFDPDFKNEIDQEMEELDDEFRDEFGQSTNLKELRIDLVSVANLKIINPATQLEITIDELKFEGFEWREGDLQSLGKLSVQSSQLDLETVPSVEFAQSKNAERFEGILRSDADHRLKLDVPFVFDFSVNNELDVSLKSELFDGHLLSSQLTDGSTLSYLDFTPSDFLDLKTAAVLPSNVNMKLEFGTEGKNGPTRVDDGSFDLGETQFRDFRIEQPEEGPNYVMATGIVNGKTVIASVKIDGPNSPWWKTSLQSDGFDSLNELWSHTLFGAQFDRLSDEQQAAVVASIPDQIAESEQATEQKSLAEQEPADVPAEADEQGQ